MINSNLLLFHFNKKLLIGEYMCLSLHELWKILNNIKLDK